jgi:alpha-tubulin suppressor-like RCC1 family protein
VLKQFRTSCEEHNGLSATNVRVGRDCVWQFYAEYKTNFSEPIQITVDDLPLGITAEVSSHDPAGLTPDYTYGAVKLRIRGAAASGPIQVTARATTSSHGTASLSVPLTIDALPGLSFKLASVSVGKDFACGLDTTGNAYCWGDNTSGQLGIGTADLRKMKPTPVVGGLSFTQIYASSGTACALTSAGKAYCWGTAFALGDGQSYKSTTPVAVNFNQPFTELTVGAAICGLTTTGAAYCWSGANGFLGNGTYDKGLVPTPVSGGQTFQSLSATTDHACGVTTSGKIYCWGNNGAGMLGDGTTIERREPAAVASSVTFKAVSVGISVSCGLASDGAAYCWGVNSSGNLGLGTPGGANQLSPVAVSGGKTFVSLKMEDGACGLDANGVAHCWGRAGTEANVINTTVSTPTPLRGGLVFTAISVGSHQSCGIASNGLAATYCWAHVGSSNSYGYLGTGDNEDYWGPVPIAAP